MMVSTERPLRVYDWVMFPVGDTVAVYSLNNEATLAFGWFMEQTATLDGDRYLVSLGRCSVDSVAIKFAGETCLLENSVGYLADFDGSSIDTVATVLMLVWEDWFTNKLNKQAVSWIV